MRVELIDDDLAGERLDAPAEPLVIEDEGQLIALRDEFDTARRKLLGECSRHGTRGFRIEDDFDITESQVFSVGGFFFATWIFALSPRNSSEARFWLP
jgi:hypothetical protein